LVKCPRVVVVLLLLAFGASADVFAQSEGKFALGGAFSVRLPADRDAVDGRQTGGLLWRFGHGHTGWGWHWGLNWYSADVDGRPTIDTEIGELHVRPVMVGYGYTHVVRRTNVSAVVIGGYALTTMTLRPQAANAYRDRFGARDVSVDPSSTFTVRPEVNVWRDLSKKIGLNVSAGYIVARPNVTIHSTLGDEVRHLRADMFTVKIGAVYSIF
jgi:hypothetical protein